MNINQLRYVLVLCEEQNFSRAARRCRISQPSLTNAVRALEDELGGALFHRKPRPRLSALGEALRPYFARIVEGVQQSREIAARVIRRHPDLSLAASRENGAGRTRHEHRLRAGRPAVGMRLIHHDHPNRHGGTQRHLP
jgi:DNA-binding transcriptional LysR family regulator